MSETTITPEMSMEEILQTYPSAQRALFQRYHVGGCSSCGFEPSDTLAQVCRDHNMLDTREVIDHILSSNETDRRLQVDPPQVRTWLETPEELRLIDVRMPQEREAQDFPEAEPLDFNDQGKYMALPKDTQLVFACQDGMRSLDVAAYFVGQGYTRVHSLRGGLEAWKAGGGG